MMLLEERLGWTSIGTPHEPSKTRHGPLISLITKLPYEVDSKIVIKNCATWNGAVIFWSSSTIIGKLE